LFWSPTFRKRSIVGNRTLDILVNDLELFLVKRFLLLLVELCQNLWISLTRGPCFGDASHQRLLDKQSLYVTIHDITPLYVELGLVVVKLATLIIVKVAWLSLHI